MQRETAASTLLDPGAQHKVHTTVSSISSSNRERRIPCHFKEYEVSLMIRRDGGTLPQHTEEADIAVSSSASYSQNGICPLPDIGCSNLPSGPLVSTASGLSLQRSAEDLKSAGV